MQPLAREARPQIFGLPRPLSVTLEVQTEYLEATLGLFKCLEISKELIRECATMPGCCCCMPLLHNHLMDSCSYVRKNTLLADKCTPFPPPPPESATAASYVGTMSETLINTAADDNLCPPHLKSSVDYYTSTNLHPSSTSPWIKLLHTCKYCMFFSTLIIYYTIATI